MAVIESMYEVMGTGTILVFLVSFLAVIYWLRKPRNLPPGPLGLPLFGYLPLLVLKIYRTGMESHEILTQMARVYGKVYSFNLMGNNVVVINDYKLLKEALQNRNLNDRQRNEISVRAIGLSAIKLETYQSYRKFAISTFRSYGFGNSSFEDMVSTEVAVLIGELKEINGEIDPKELFQIATTNIFCAVVFGKRYEYNDKRFTHLLNVIDQWNDHLGAGLMELFLPVLKHIPTKAKQGLRECAEVIASFLETIVAEHKKEFDQNHLKDFIDAYLNQQRIQSGEDLEETSWLTDFNMRGNLFALFGAGGDTTSSVLCWALVYLTTHPLIQENIHHEMDTIIGRNRLPRLSDRDKLPMTRAFILELIRITCIVPLGVAHTAGKSVRLDEYTIPKGSTVIPNIWAIHHDPNLWEDPERFCPERFLDENGQVREREEVITFSVGRRSCPGEALAKTMLYIFVTHLLHKFSFAIPEGSAKPSLKGNLGIVYKPKPFKVELIKRY